jgi:hypothetical protein
MSEQGRVEGREVRGVIRRRLLVNAVVDPDEAARHLPPGLRPRVTAGGTVIGCCLLDIDQIRPALFPSVLGVRLRAAAHRISSEWDDESGITTVGVYVPVRHTDSRSAVMIGGRWFPGVHRRAAVRVVETDDSLRWTVEPAREASSFRVRVVTSTSTTAPSVPCEPIGGTCLAASTGVSPNHRGLLEAARMEPGHRRAVQVRIDELESEFLAGFATARPAPSYLMKDVQVVWAPERLPTFAGAATIT